MRATKNNLQYQKASLDFEALVKTATIAVRWSLENIEKNIALLKNEPEKSLSYLFAERIKDTATELVTITETYSTLMGAIDRPILEIVSKPKIEEEKE